MTVSSTTGAATGALPVAGGGQQSAAAKAAATKEQFLKLLVAQMRYQDPESPSDPTQMMTQLAQFSSVEQLMTINEQLTNQAAQNAQAFSLSQTATALSAIGKTVVAQGNVLVQSAGAPASEIEANVGAVGQGKLVIRDANGVAVRETSLGLVSAGDQSFSVIGLTNDLPPGRYTFDLTVTAADGSDVPVTPYMTTTVEGVTPSAQGLMLVTGNGLVPFSSVKEIYR